MNSLDSNNRITRKIFNSFINKCENNLSTINYTLPREKYNIKTQNSFTILQNIHTIKKTIILKGDRRIGTTKYLSHYIINTIYPYYSRFFIPPLGLYLTGNYNSHTINNWLKSQLPYMETITKDTNYFILLEDLLIQQYNKQKFKILLLQLFIKFNKKLPYILQPKPTIIVIDNAEMLLFSYRAEFLVYFSSLIQLSNNSNIVKIIFIVNSNNAIKALNLIYGKHMYDIIYTPKVDINAIKTQYNQEFVQIFADCNSNIGISDDYISDTNKKKNITVQEYSNIQHNIYSNSCCLTKEITLEELNKARKSSI